MHVFTRFYIGGLLMLATLFTLGCGKKSNLTLPPPSENTEQTLSTQQTETLHLTRSQETL